MKNKKNLQTYLNKLNSEIDNKSLFTQDELHGLISENSWYRDKKQ